MKNKFILFFIILFATAILIVESDKRKHKRHFSNNFYNNKRFQLLLSAIDRLYYFEHFSYIILTSNLNEQSFYSIYQKK